MNISTLRRNACATLLALLALPGCAAAPSTPPSGGEDGDAPRYAAREDVRAAAAAIAERRGLDADWVAATLAEARRLPSVQRLIQPPVAGTARNWSAYRARFVEPVRIRAGVSFWRDHAATLREAEARWGVPAEVVIGILGVETLYGRHMGNYRVLDTLATLAFDFPKEARRDRSAYFLSELEHFLLLSHQQSRSPLEPRGSYAGASGLPQFMPSSVLNYAVDFDGDGRIDLQASPADAIGSVANYLAAHGWQSGLATHHGVRVPVDVSDRAVLLGPDIVPSFTAAQFAERGAVLDDAGAAHQGLLALVELQNGSAAPTYVAGTQNFYAITRYNQSSYYALAVIELGAAVRTVVEATR